MFHKNYFYDERKGKKYMSGDDSFRRIGKIIESKTMKAFWEWKKM